MNTFAENADGGKRAQAAVPWTVRLPVYTASIGLFVVYAWGYLQVDVGVLAWALIGVTAMSELLKPQLGEMAARAARTGDVAVQRIILAAVAVSVLIGAGGGVVAMSAADAPRARYEALQAAHSAALAAVLEAQRQVDRIPTCEPDMPVTRCNRMLDAIAGVAVERHDRLRHAQTVETAAAAALARAMKPGPGLPRVEIWQKALFVSAAEILIFGAPFAAMRIAQNGDRDLPIPSAPGGRTNAAVNDGGWERRRAKYGPTGRKLKTTTGSPSGGAKSASRPLAAC